MSTRHEPAPASTASLCFDEADVVDDQIDGVGLIDAGVAHDGHRDAGRQAAAVKLALRWEAAAEAAHVRAAALLHQPGARDLVARAVDEERELLPELDAALHAESDAGEARGVE